MGKFNNKQPANKKQGSSYNSPARDNQIHKNAKKTNPKINTNPPKPQPQTSNQTQNQKFPPPPPFVAPAKPLTETGKNNLAKLASINKLMGTILPTTNVKTGK